MGTKLLRSERYYATNNYEGINNSMTLEKLTLIIYAITIKF